MLEDNTREVQFWILKYSVFPYRVFQIVLGCPASYTFDLIPSSPIVNSLQRNCPFVGRVLGDVIDPRLAGEWINACQNLHNGKCSPIGERSFDFELRAVDVNDLKLSVVPKSAQYIALSYVWGSVEASLTTKDNLQARTQPGSPRSVVANSAHVIQDAVELVRAM